LAARIFAQTSHSFRMTAPSTLQLPADVTPALDALSDSLRSAAGDNLLGLILFGGLSRGRYVPGSSDINVVVFLRDASAAALSRIAEPLRDAWRAKRVDPFIITPAEVPRLAITFPTKILDIQRRHVVLFGADPFTNITVDREHVRARVEQELRNLALRMRHRFVKVHDDPAALATAADDAAAPLAVNLRALLYLRKVVSNDVQPALAIYDLAAKTFGLDSEALAATKRVHQGPHEATLTPELFGRLLSTVSRAADAAASLEL
jgi:predicted nucleotidyltransferase